ncbi:MAG TPA: hypothetical protein VKV40_20430 [Ktedonobacteraceae bacterium]|nr:hypothetical protein [Ktedonobacteraceae bacterium]
MVATAMRKSLLTALMVLTLAAGLITGFAHTKVAALTHTMSVRPVHGQIAGYCPAPPYVCVPKL